MMTKTETFAEPLHGEVLQLEEPELEYCSTIVSLEAGRLEKPRGEGWRLVLMHESFMAIWTRPITPAPRSVTTPSRSTARAATARELYGAYCDKAGGVSLVTGAKLPAFEECPEAVRAAWHASAEIAALAAILPFPPAP